MFRQILFEFKIFKVTYIFSGEQLINDNCYHVNIETEYEYVCTANPNNDVRRLAAGPTLAMTFSHRHRLRAPPCHSPKPTPLLLSQALPHLLPTPCYTVTPSLLLFIPLNTVISFFSSTLRAPPNGFYMKPKPPNSISIYIQMKHIT